MAGKYDPKTGIWEPEERFEDRLSPYDKILFKQGAGSPPVNNMYDMIKWRNDVCRCNQLAEQQKRFNEQRDKERKEEEQRRQEELKREFDQRQRENQFNLLNKKNYYDYD